jgi:hypothetical protein
MNPRSDRILDDKGRWRNKTVAFRLTEEEDKLLNDCIALSGLTKQNYITNKLLNREIVVQGNPRVHKALRNKMAEISSELKGIESCSELSDEFLAVLRMIAEIMEGLRGDVDIGMDNVSSSAGK